MFQLKNRPFAKRDGQLEETHANVLLLVTPKRYTNANEYCIIFGAVTQAEQPFCAGCYFYTLRR